MEIAQKPKTRTLDGNQAAALASYALTEVAAIFPITPSSPMAESVDDWSARGLTNIFGQTVRVVEMQSEAGAAGAVHGSLQAGALTTTYTASQGLLLMIPNMYKMAGQLLPGVIHVTARALATHALSIFGDHQDVMACRQTGFALLASASVQEAHDLAYVAHLSAIKSRVPFLHFFDGFRTSHEIQKIGIIDQENIAELVDREALQAFRNRALNPEHPFARGTAQNPDIYFQGREAANPFYAAVPDIVEAYMREIQRLTGREYHPFDYYGVPDATDIIVAMGSVCETIEETVEYLNARGEKVGVIKVHLYRPFSRSYFLKVMPPSVQRIAVLDRTKEPGAPGESLYLDIIHLLHSLPDSGRDLPQKLVPIIIGGRYGLGSKDTRPAQILAVFKNLRQKEPKDHFTIGINDDVTHTSLSAEDNIETTPDGTYSCKFWGLGSDGTVGANKAAIKIIGEHTDLYVQGYFAYDSKKSGGTTVSHLRFGSRPIKSTYLVDKADYIACHNHSFLNHYDVLKGLKPGGMFVLNCPWNDNELDTQLPTQMRAYLAQNKIKFFVIDAVQIAKEIGLGARINMIMQAVFFKLSNVIPLDEAITYLKQEIAKTYGKKGNKIVAMNGQAVERGLAEVRQVMVPASWATPYPDQISPDTGAEPEFVRRIQRPMARMEGDDLPVSAFIGMEDGTHPLGTTAYEKRGIAVMLPEWQIDACIQCNRCAYVCPHATIRPFLLNEAEKDHAPTSFKTKDALGQGITGFQYRVQVSPLDCTGCGNCADVCPAPGKALIMKPASQEIAAEAANWDYAMTVSAKEKLLSPNTLRGSQFVRPLLEFNGACPGCGETPYIKLLTQLFGDRMLIANATGCSSIWGASSPSIAYTTNTKGQGPAWANSLFEDNAEFGYGLYLGVQQNRERLAFLLRQALTQDVSSEFRKACQEWLDHKDELEGSRRAAEKLMASLASPNSNRIVMEIQRLQDYLVKKSIWIIGGDGWAYDIGYGGVDHVLASGQDVNLFVMDTEVYSNTGGQSSKATPTAAVAKFAAAGKKTRKKDLGLMAMSYGYVYVAQVAMGANMSQTLKAIVEAESYPGPSLIIAYSPCINHGIKTGMGTSIAEEQKAVASGYWHLYRYNPLMKQQGKNPFTLDSPEPTEKFDDFLQGEVRYAQLANLFPEIAAQMFAAAAAHAQERYATYKRLAAERPDGVISQDAALLSEERYF